MEGSRGASGFSAEPGFAGAMAVFYFAIAIFLSESRGQVYYLKTTIFLCVVMVILTKSGTGGLLLLIFVLAIYAKFRFVHLIFGLGLLVLLVILVNVLDFGRADYAVRLLFEDPRHLFLVDASVGQRVLNITIGILSVVEFPLGRGSGSYDFVAEFILDKYQISSYISGKSGNVSAFAKYSVELGLIFWIFISYFVGRCLLTYGLASIKYLIVALFFLSASFSIVFPPIWFIFAVLHSEGRLTHFLRARSIGSSPNRIKQYN